MSESKIKIISSNLSYVEQFQFTGFNAKENSENNGNIEYKKDIKKNDLIRIVVGFSTFICISTSVINLNKPVSNIYQTSLSSTENFETIKTQRVNSSNEVINVEDLQKRQESEESEMRLAEMLNGTIEFEKVISKIGMLVGCSILLSNLLIFQINWKYAFTASILGFGLSLYTKVRAWERR